MSIKLLTVAALSLALAGPAFAQTSGSGTGGNTAPSTSGGEPPTDFEIGDRAVFVNEDNNTMRTETEARDRFMAMPADRQQAIRDACVAYRDNVRAGSSDLTDGQANPTDPVPGVFNMATACQWTQSF